MTDKVQTVSAELPVPVVSLQAWAERRQAFNEWVNTQLRDGVDYGEIPGTDKPTLLKPGAEKILQYYGCAPVPEIALRRDDPQTGYLYVECIAKAVSLQTGQVVGQGLGACSSYESKYRYRWEWWNAQGNPDPGLGYEQTRSGKWRRRVENRDLIDAWNTVVKIAKKRATVDLALSISGASEKFTQDVEDMQDVPAPKKPERARQPWVTDAKILGRFWDWTNNYLALLEEQVLEALGVQALADYTGSMKDAKARIEAWLAAQANQGEPSPEGEIEE